MAYITPWDGNEFEFEDPSEELPRTAHINTTSCESYSQGKAKGSSIDQDNEWKGTQQSAYYQHQCFDTPVKQTRRSLVGSGSNFKTHTPESPIPVDLEEEDSSCEILTKNHGNISDDEEMAVESDPEEVESRVIYDSEKQELRCRKLKSLLCDQIEFNIEISDFDLEVRVKHMQVAYDKYCLLQEESKVDMESLERINNLTAFTQQNCGSIDIRNLDSNGIMASKMNPYNLNQAYDLMHSAQQHRSIQEESKFVEIAPMIATRRLRLHHYFIGPDRKCISPKIKKLLLTAKHRVLVCCYSITDGIINSELVQQLKDKLDDFRIITDQQQMRGAYMLKYTNAFHELGIPIKFNVVAKNAMHSKFIVIDDKFLIMGSMNMGKKSLNNYEHISVLRDQESIGTFADRFEEMWADKQRFSDYFLDIVK